MKRRFRMAWGVLQGFFRAMTGSYALSVLLLLIARVMIGEENWSLITFFNSIIHLLWIPALVLLPLTLLLREWRLSAMLVPAVAAFLLAYGGQWLPRTVPAPAENALTILTYNIEAPNRQHQDVIDIIRAADADVVALQEVSRGIAPLLEDQFADAYPYIALHTNRNDYAGQGILSRLPIVEDTYWQTDPQQTLGHQRVELRLLDETTFTLYNIHTVPPRAAGVFFNPALRDRDIHSLLTLFPLETDPLVVVGDFNMTDQNRQYFQITADLRDAYREAGYGMGWTFPNLAWLPAPLLRIDYVFYSDDWTAYEAQVLPDSGGSDHSPLKVTLARTP